MKQKLFLGALLLGALTLNSCVDDNESASVTAIRQAKLEQLKSIAELNSANAQAALLLANAEAAANQAKAEYDKAMAEYQKALTEREKELAQIAVEAARAELQAQIAAFEAQIAMSKYDAARYEKQLKDILNGTDEASREQMQKLLGEFETASKDLIDAKRDLARDNASLIELEADLAGIPETINKDIQSLKDKNSENQLAIADQQAIIDAYQKYAGKEVTQEDADAAHLKMVELNAAYKEAQENAYDTYEAKQEADVALNEYSQEIFNNWVYGNKNLSYSEWNESTNRYDNYYVTIQRAWSNVPSAMRGKYCVVIDHQRNNEKEYLPLFDEWATNDETIDFTYGDNATGSVSYWTYESFYNLIDGGKALETLVSHKEKQIEQWKNPDYTKYLTESLAEWQKNKEAAQKAFDEALADYNKAKAAAEAADVAAEDAQDAYNAAAEAAGKAWDAFNQNTDDTKTEELRKAAEDADKARDEAWTKLEEAWAKSSDANNAKYTAENERNNALNELDYATEQVNNYQGWINNQENNVEEYTKQLAQFKEDVAKLIEIGTANDANIKAYNEAAVADAKASVARDIAGYNYSAQRTEYDALQNAVWSGGIMDGDGDANDKVIAAKAEIENLNSMIEENNEMIADYEQDLADLESGKNSEAETKKNAIELKKDQIEKDKVALEVAQKKYDNAKAALDAAAEAQ